MTQDNSPCKHYIAVSQKMFFGFLLTILTLQLTISFGIVQIHEQSPHHHGSASKVVVDELVNRVNSLAPKDLTEKDIARQWESLKNNDSKNQIMIIELSKRIDRIEDNSEKSFQVINDKFDKLFDMILKNVEKKE